MPELLLELGCEELPATAVRRAYTELHQRIEAGLQEAGIDYQQGNPPIGTPRRLIVHLTNVADRQPDQQKESRGPALGSAFDEAGNPSKALEGFCRGQGVEVAEVEKRDGYVWVNKVIPGRPTIEILQELLPTAIRALTFDKTMRWGSSRMRFARPIRWILASFGGNPVSFDIEGVNSGLESRGHRFYAPEPFEAKSLDELLNGLMARKVEPDPKERETTIRETTIRMASGEPEMTDALVDENVFLTEWPTPIEGTFKASYLELPESVLVTAMAKHEKMFPLRDRAGKLINKFVFVRNSGDDDTVRAGAEWVLNARFNDAQFFFNEDKKFKLEHFLNAGSNVVFQEKLGTVRQRADRLSALAEWIADQTGASAEEQALAKQAGLFAKADLTTGLVGELASLQGIIGGEYARREGFPEAVCQAIATQYDLGKAQKLSGVAGDTALRIILADQVDKLAGYLGMGQIPTSSSDPMGLRRAVTQCIEASWDRWDLDFAGLISVAVTLYARQDVDLDVEGAKQAAKEIFATRYESLLPNTRYDQVAAAVMEDFGWEACRPKRVKYRLQVIEKLANDVAFVQTASRPINIVRAALEKNEVIIEENPLKTLDRSSLKSEQGIALASALDSIAGKNWSDPAAHAADLKSLEAAINAFFDSTMVMSQDAKERLARLSLVNAAREILLSAGDLSKIVLEG